MSAFEKDITDDEILECIKANPLTISKIENGKFRITVDYLVRFSIFLDYEFKLMVKEVYVFYHIKEFKMPIN